jgi:hypothetical protein
LGHTQGGPDAGVLGLRKLHSIRKIPVDHAGAALGLKQLA